MHRAAVWQHSSNSNIKIVHNSINHFLWNPSDFSSDDVLSCLWIVFTNSVFQVLPEKIGRLRSWEYDGQISVWRKISLSHAKLCLRYSSVLFCLKNEAPPNFSNRTLEYLRHNFPRDRLILHKTNNPKPSYTQELNPPNNLLRGYLKDRVCENNPQTTEDIIRKEIRWIPQEMLNRVVDNFNVRVAAVLSYSSAVHGTNIVLITEKV